MSAGTRRSILAGLIGQGVKPSLTPELHEREAQRQGLRYVYKTIDLQGDQLDPARLRQLLAYAIDLGFDALNVTHPIKQAMVPLVDDLAPDVAAIGALNTIVITEGATVGYNTDVVGFDAALRTGLDDVRLDSVILLGAGGAGTAVAHALATAGVGRLRVVDPNTDRIAQLVASLERLDTTTDVSALDPAELRPALARAAGVVNATPIGMVGHPGTPVAVDALQPDLWVADIVYRPLQTELLQGAQRRGCRVLSGAGMAVNQAAASFHLITDRPADPEAMARDFDDLVAREVEPVPPRTPNTATPGERNP